MSNNKKVLIYGIDTPIGLAIIRELGSNGIDVYGIGKSKRAIGLYSKYLKKGIIYSHGHGQELITLINTLSEESKIPYLITIAEADIIFFNQNAKQFKSIKFLFPTQDIMSRVLDKSQTYEFAQKVGINIPKSYQFNDLGNFSNKISQLSFPVVLKWSNPEKVTKQLAQHNLSFFKFKYIYNSSDLLSLLKKYEVIGTFPLIQEFCAGTGLGQMIYMHNGIAVQKFQHIRINEWPPEGGVSSYCKSLPLYQHSELMEKSIKLLQLINWEGVAMVEYRYDPKNEQAVLMEINGRYWGSFPLAYHAGAKFSLLSYLTAQNTYINQNKYTENINCMYLIPELKRLYRVLFHPDLIQNKQLKFNKNKEFFLFLFRLFNPVNYYYIFKINDPKPAMMDFLFILKKIIKR